MKSNNFISNYLRMMKLWSKKKILNIFIFNLLLMILVLLHSLGYFNPFFPITVNLIVFISLLLSILLLGANSKIIIFIGLVFWGGSLIFKLLHIDVWAERGGMYTFHALIVGVVVFIIETAYNNKNA